MEFVQIGSPGNAADTTGAPSPAGSVSYVYSIGKFEVSEDMIEKANTLGGLGITKDTRGVNKPATSVNWNEAARFINWLNTSQGFSPAYKFEFQPGEVGYNSSANIQLWTMSDAGYNAANPFRNSQANYFLPSVDEWYKAAYYDPNANTYYNYPTGSDTLPTAVSGGTGADTAVYGNTVTIPADIDNAGDLSPFGVMALGGNAWEWEETEIDLINDSTSTMRGVRGGGWGYAFNNMLATARGGGTPATDGSFVGFRVASLSPVPEPGTYALALSGLAMWGCWRWRRGHK